MPFPWLSKPIQKRLIGKTVTASVTLEEVLATAPFTGPPALGRFRNSCRPRSGLRDLQPRSRKHAEASSAAPETPPNAVGHAQDSKQAIGPSRQPIAAIARLTSQQNPSVCSKSQRAKSDDPLCRLADSLEPGR